MFSASLFAVELDFYLPKEKYNPDVPTPESVIGYQVGDWHIRHDQLVQYFKELAKSSERLSLEVIGYSHEQRPLLQLVITSPENQNNLEQIRTAHLERLGQSKKPNSSNYPLVASLNYSVHGDESSGSNASMLVAYYLAASNSEKVKAYLNDMVIILDPSLNPDGLSRFAQWANQHKGMNLNGDGQNREHIQPWIRGRVNHYWFDLNRDWLLLQHPESRARIAKYHQWRPNVLTDHHEMGGHSTFFFQPGIPSRKNPLTPDENVELTSLLGTYHADAFDKQNSLYFTKEAFDDFYAGKGSTYPDLHGTIGILFEQGSSRGHLHETINGDLDFPTTIKNQITASFSTLDGSLENKDKLLDFQWKFENDAKKIAKDSDLDGYLIGDAHDAGRLAEMLALISQHNIKAYPLTKNYKVKGQTFEAGKAAFIPMTQPQVRLIQSIFSEATSFNDNTFYDVSSWNLAMAYNLDFAALESTRGLKYSAQTWQEESSVNQVAVDAYSYAIDWTDYRAPELVYRLLEKGLVLRAGLKPVSANTKNGVVDFPAGTMFVHAGLQRGDWQSKFLNLVNNSQVKVSEIASGLSVRGIDLGSRNMLPVTKPKVLVVGGMGTNLYEVGETWYLFDKHMGFSPTIINKTRLSNIDLNSYTHVILTDGSYSSKDDELASQLKSWVTQGGVLWGQKRAAMWLAQKDLLKAEYIDSKGMNKRFDDSELKYSDREVLAGRQRIAGAFFNTELDLSHPLAFGLQQSELAIFKNRTELLLEPDSAFTQVAKYTKNPLISGYADEINVEKIAGATALLAHESGKGVVIGMTDNPNFRAITYGTSRFLFNALYLAHGIDN